jgi:hypothetical protein
LKPKFGHTVIEDGSPISILLETADTLDSDAAQIVMSMGYDKAFGIYDHNAIGASPLSPLLYQDKEDYFEYSGIYRAILRYNRQEIQQLFGMSLIEYLHLPKHMVDMITKIVIKLAEQRKAAQDSIKRGVEHDINNPGGSWGPVPGKK